MIDLPAKGDRDGIGKGAHATVSGQGHLPHHRDADIVHIAAVDGDADGLVDPDGLRATGIGA